MTQQAEPDLNEEPVGIDEVVPNSEEMSLVAASAEVCTILHFLSQIVQMFWFNPLRICRVIVISLSDCYNSVASSS